MEASPVVLDACVLVPAALRDTLLTLFNAGLYEARWSESILEEVERVLTRMVGTVRAENLIDTIREAFPEADVADYQPLVDEMPTRDPADRHVLAIAVACGARFIVTSNIRDFPEAALRPLNV